MFDPLRAKTKVVLYSSITFLFGVGLASGLGWTAPTHALPAVDSEPQVSEEAVRPALDLSEAFVSIAEEVTPAVVRIETRRSRTVASRGPGDEFFRRFFDIPQGEDGPRQLPPQVSGGSGFIVSQDGYILTNDHVVSDAERITVWLNDRRYFPAELVGTDPTTDVAVIKIEADGLSTLSFGSSDDVRVGEWVLAVGNPGFGGAGQLDYTVTAGIVSAKGRPLGLIGQELRGDPQYGEDVARYSIEDFIQTDAVINPGNSGGPLVDLRGQVVGISSAIASETGYYQGYGFAIPVNLAARVMEDLIEYGQVRRPRLGVAIDNITPEDAEYYGLPSVSGVLVQTVPEDGPAHGAGIRMGDVIVAIDGEPVDRPGQLQQRIAQKRPGERVSVRLYRAGEPMEVRVRLDEAPLAALPQRTVERTPRAEEKLGIQVDDLTPELARQIGYEDAGGAVIVDVSPVGPAARRGVQRYLKIVEIDGQTVSTADDVKELLQEHEPGDIVSLLLEDREGGSRIVNVRVPS